VLTKATLSKYIKLFFVNSIIRVGMWCESVDDNKNDRTKCSDNLQTSKVKE